MFGFDANDTENDQTHTGAQICDRVREWTRVRFGLDKDAAILIAELNCSVPGCPPLETAIAFWTADDVRYQFKLLRPVAEIVQSDIAWLIGDLNEQETNYWDCC